MVHTTLQEILLRIMSLSSYIMIMWGSQILAYLLANRSARGTKVVCS